MLYFTTFLFLALTPIHASTPNSNSNSNTHTPAAALSFPVLEQKIEDFNAVQAASPNDSSNGCPRRLIALPLTPSFSAPKGTFSHGHTQTGDKCCLPKTYWSLISKGGMAKLPEVPWLFEVSRLDDETLDYYEPRVKVKDGNSNNKLQRVVGGALDFRSPSNFIFLPHWMMRSLGIKPKDVVNVRFTAATPPGSLVKLRPVGQNGGEFLRISNHQSVLETELRHYSCLTRGSRIPFDYNSKRYIFDVVDLREAPGGGRVPVAKVQDCDIAVDFLKARK